jgi:ABC-type multidrug transport system ATPase subunit
VSVETIILEKGVVRYGSFIALGGPPAGSETPSGVSLALAPGRFYALLGPNGSGKSTLLRLLCGQRELVRGSGRILDAPMGSDPARIYDRVAFVSEENLLETTASVEALAFLKRQLYRTWDGASWERLARLFGFPLDRDYRTLSRGQQIQVQFALAAAIRPKVLLLDEVTSVLDPEAKEVLMGACRTLASEGAMVVLATSLVAELDGAFDHLLILNGGLLVFDKSWKEVPELFRKLRTQDLYAHPVFKSPSCVPLAKNSDRAALGDAADAYTPPKKTKTLSQLLDEPNRRVGEKKVVRVDTRALLAIPLDDRPPPRKLTRREVLEESQRKADQEARALEPLHEGVLSSRWLAMPEVARWVYEFIRSQSLWAVSEERLACQRLPFQNEKQVRQDPHPEFMDACLWLLSTQRGLREERGVSPFGHEDLFPFEAHFSYLPEDDQRWVLNALGFSLPFDRGRGL